MTAGAGRQGPARGLDVLTPCAPTTPTPTWCCRRSSASTGSPAATPRWPPSSSSGAIRMHGLYDAVIDACLTKPLRVQPEVRDVLRLGAHQLLSMRVPDHAAISTSVDLVRATVGRGPAGLVNAVLRTISRRDLAGWVDEVAPDQGRPVRPLGRPVPPALGRRGAGGGAGVRQRRVDALLAADNAPPRVTLVARPRHVDGRGARGRRWHPHRPVAVRAVTLAGGSGRRPGGRRGTRRGAGRGFAGRRARARRRPVDGRDERWLDLCAGPGGKAALLAALAAQRGAVLVANERHRPGRAGRHRAAATPRAPRSARR